MILIALVKDQEDALFGYGAWTHAQADLAGERVTVIRVPWFGVDRRYHGAVDSSGQKCAGVLYATLEADARADDASREDMLIELFCAEENERGLRFWRRRGFRYVQTTESPSGRYQRLVR